MKYFALGSKAVKWISFSLLALFLIFIGINAFDENLKPEAQAALKWQSPKEMLNDNGYIVLLGLDAPINEDAMQVGTKRYQVELERYQTTQTTHTEPTVTHVTLNSEFADEKWKVFRCDYVQQENCVNFYRNLTAADLALFYQSQKLLEARFKAIRHSKQYVEAMPPLLTAYIPSYASLVLASELVRMKSVRLIAEGKVKDGVVLFVDNAQFSRQLIQKSNSLISRMVAVAMAQRDMRILSELITEYPLIASDFSETLSPITVSILSPEYSFKNPLQSERNAMLHAMYQLRYEISKKANVVSKFVTNLFFQPNATVNLFYDWWEPILGSANLNPIVILETQSKVQKQQQALLGWGYAPYYIKNPIAKILVSVAQPDYSKYIERQYDLEGYIQLVGLQIEMSNVNVSKVGTEPEMAAIFTAHLNPYTGKPMRYDAIKHEIAFDGHRESNSNYAKRHIFEARLSH